MIRLFSNLLLLCILVLIGFILFDRYSKKQIPQPAPITEQIDRILIEKSLRRLTVYRGKIKLREYQIALGFAPAGNKVLEGDGKTPEGLFKINRRNPKSGYHLSLGINYPRPADIARAKAQGVSPGGDIFIHGQPNGLGRVSTLSYDWTAGCIAVSDTEIEELWRITPMGTIVEIRP